MKGTGQTRIAYKLADKTQIIAINLLLSRTTPYVFLINIFSTAFSVKTITINFENFYVKKVGILILLLCTH